MKGRKFLIGMAALVFSAVASYQSAIPVKAVTVGQPGQTLTEDYVVIVNTSPEYTATQSTGVITFDATGGTTTGTTSTGTTSTGTTSTETTNTGTTSGITTNTMGISSTENDNMKDIPVTIVANDSKTTAVTYTQGQVKYWFNSKNYTCIGVGQYCYIWMENSKKTEFDNAGKTDMLKQDIMEAYDVGAYPYLAQLAQNNIPYSDGADKISIFLETTSTGGDYFETGTTVTGFRINLPPVAAWYSKGGMSNRASTFVHEGQHGLYNRRACRSNAFLAGQIRWFDEGLAVNSMFYIAGGNDTGWLSKIPSSNSLNADQTSDTYKPLVYIHNGHTDDPVLDYSMPALYVRYLIDQYKQSYAPLDFFRTIYNNPTTLSTSVNDTKGVISEQYLNTLFQKLGLKGASGGQLTFRESLGNFYAAVLAQTNTGVYGFYGDRVVSRSVYDYPMYQGTSGQAAMIKGSGAIMVKTANNRFVVPNNAGADIKFYGVNKPTNVLKPAKGSGTQVDPYIISGARDIDSMAYYHDKYFKLETDLDLTGDKFTTIDRFEGTLDGNGKKIINLNNTLFAQITGTVKNLTIEAKLEGDFNTFGGVLATQNAGTIQDCYVHGTYKVRISANSPNLETYFGAIVGNNNYGGKILRSYSDTNLTIETPYAKTYVGGIVGVNDGTIEDCYSAGSINLTSNATKSGTGTTAILSMYEVGAGGIAGGVGGVLLGLPSSNPKVTRCYSSTSINCQAPNTQPAKILVGRVVGQEGNRTASSAFVNSFGLIGMKMSGSSRILTDAAASKTQTQLQTQSTFTGWDFSTIWKLNAGSYPSFIKDVVVVPPSVTPVFPRTTHYLGEDLDLTGATLTLSQGGSVPITTSMLTLSDYNSNTVGDRTIRGTYNGMSFTLKTKVVAPTSVQSVGIKKEGKKDYNAGNLFDTSGYELVVRVDNKTTDVIIKRTFTVDKTQALIGTDKQVIFTYQGKSVAQPITVTDKTVTGISVVTALQNKVYTVGEPLAMSAVRVKITYRDGSTTANLAPSAFGTNNIKVALKKSGTSSEFNTSNALAIGQHQSEVMVYVGNTLPHQTGSIAASLGTISVYSPMAMTGVNLSWVVNRAYTNQQSAGLTGGSGNFTTTLVSGTKPAWLTVNAMPNTTGRVFTFSGTPTAQTQATLTYQIKDNVTLKTLQVTVQVTSVFINNQALVTNMKLLKSANTGLTADITGTINGQNITFVVPKTANFANLALDFTLSDGATATLTKGQRVDLTSGKVVSLTVTAEDKTTKKTYSITATQEVEIVTLQAPANLAWQNKTATWNQVANASSYLVSLFKNGTLVSGNLTATGTTYDFTNLTKEFGDYTFKVSAKGNGTTYLDSTQATSPVNKVVDKTVTGITLVTALQKKQYTVGDKLALDAIKVRLSYRDGTNSGDLAFSSFGTNGLKLALKNGTTSSVFATGNALAMEQNQGELFVYAGNLLPHQSGSVKVSLGTISVYNTMSMSGINLNWTVNKSYTNQQSAAVTGGSGNFTTSLISGTKPAWLTVSTPNASQRTFTFSGTPTAPTNVTLTYQIKDNATGKTISVTVEVVAVASNNQAQVTGATLRQSANTGLSADIKGTINGDTISFVVPQAANVSNLAVEFMINEGATANLTSGQRMDLSNGKVVSLTVTAPDKVTVKTYKLSASLEVVEAQLVINPTTLQLKAGETYSFTSNLAADQVKYAISGNGSTQTTISQNGVLTVGADEESLELMVRVFSISNVKNYAEAVVKVEPKVNPITPGWEADGLGRRYRKIDGSYAANEWLVLEGKRYHFQGDTYVSKGWYTEATKSYYLDDLGAMATGWKKLDGKWYYLGTDGIKATNWKKVGGKWYYLGTDGIMTTGWKKVSGKWYYMASSGAMTTGWVKSGGKWYYLASSGVMTTGWKKVSNKWYYLASSGIMTTGWQKVSNKWYYLASSGIMTTGWQKVSNKWYYLGSDGIMRTNWQKVSNKWYYLGSNGIMTTGWQKISNKWYYLGTNGIMVTGWKRIGTNWYYMKASGVMTANEVLTISGVKYRFLSNGVWAK